VRPVDLHWSGYGFRYTATEVLSGDNAYSCEQCKQKVTAERRLCFEVAPNVLQICLKRFVSVGGPSRSAAATMVNGQTLATCQL
jgi:ubiquitin C-terminal hydrolase